MKIDSAEEAPYQRFDDKVRSMADEIERLSDRMDMIESGPQIGVVAVMYRRIKRESEIAAGTLLLDMENRSVLMVFGTAAEAVSGVRVCSYVELSGYSGAVGGTKMRPVGEVAGGDFRIIGFQFKP